jgi:AcrR family transcriptional regulator
MGGQGGGRRAYHHGDLRAALVDGTLDLIAEHGVAGFSVAEVARRVGVSAAAPYRHFPDRESLLAAAASASARRLTERIRAAAETAPDDPVERLAATAGAYSRFVVERRAGLDLMFTPGLRDQRDGELRAATRALMDELLPLAVAVTTGDFRAAIELVENHLALAHGYAVLHLGGISPMSHSQNPEAVVAHAVDAARTLIVGHRRVHAEPGAAMVRVPSAPLAESP